MQIKESREDFRQRYNSCIVRIREKEELKYLYVDDVSDHKTKLLGSILDEKSNTWVPASFQTKDITFDASWPRLGLINAKKSVVRLSRVPQRQWRQGYCTALVSWVSPTSAIEYIFHLATFSRDDLMRPHFIKEVFNPSYYDNATAIRKLTSGVRIAAALTPDLYLSLSWAEDGIFLGYKDCLIGKMDISNVLEPSVTLFNGAEDLNEIIQLQQIRVGGIL